MAEVTDFHTHAFPDKIADRTIAALAATCGQTPTHNGRAESLRDAALAGGVNRSLVLPVVTKPSQFESINRFAAEIDRMPGLRSFGGIHPDCENPEEKLAFIRSLGLRGIKLHPDYQGAFIDDPRYVRIAKAALREGLAVITHAGIDPIAPDFVRCPPARAARFLTLVYEGMSEEEKSRAVLIFAHMGAAGMYDEVLRHLAGRGAYFDTAFVLPRMSPDDAMTMIRAQGADKILFATDAPWGAPAEFLAALDRAPLREDEKELILHGNADRILGREGYA